MNDPDDVLEVSVHIAATPETVFPYFTDPARYVLWMGIRAELEPHPGGIYRVTMSDGVQASGEFLEVHPPHRLVFSWGWNHDHAVSSGLHPRRGDIRRRGRRHPRRPAPCRATRRRTKRAPPEGLGAVPGSALTRLNRPGPGHWRLSRISRHKWCADHAAPSATM